jgi:hypothetical protein
MTQPQVKDGSAISVAKPGKMTLALNIISSGPNPLVIHLIPPPILMGFTGR